MQCKEVLKELKSHHNPKNVDGMARFGINPKNTYGVTIPILRKMAKKIGKDHDLAQKLWDSEIHEARILAAMVDEPEKVTPSQMDKWAHDFDSWDVCDQVCMNLFDRVPYSYQKAAEWSAKKEEFVRRAGFALMAVLAWHDKTAKDEQFEKFLPIIARESTDGRNFVKKAVNWALRQIGKRSVLLNKKALETAEDILKIDAKSTQWIASDAIKELRSDAVQKKLRK